MLPQPARPVGRHHSQIRETRAQYTLSCRIVYGTGNEPDSQTHGNGPETVEHTLSRKISYGTGNGSEALGQHTRRVACGMCGALFLRGKKAKSWSYWGSNPGPQRY